MDCHYLNAFAAASTAALRQGFHSAGAEDNAILIFSELMDSQSLFLTANADTVYYVAIVDLTNGPMVVQPPRWPWAPSTICGSAGSSTSACPAPTGARAAGTCSSPRP